MTKKTLKQLDQSLAEQYGSYASYRHKTDPFLVKTYRDGPADEDVMQNHHWLVKAYSWLNLFPVSNKEYFFESFFRDADHLIAYLSQDTSFYSWPMPPTPYDESLDREALDLYIRYNTANEGIRVINHRKVYLFRRTAVLSAPALPV